MLLTACHCGAVRIEVTPAPDWVLDCNCSICRRYGALWAYAHDRESGKRIAMALTRGADNLDTYIWGDRMLGFHRCKTCGCVTHHTALDKPDQVRAVNARMFFNFDPESVEIRRRDNAHTGRFWSRPDSEILEGGQAPAPPPGPDDWR
ncbi:MAG: hypothetical protein U1E50_18335 [Caulobacteraceae bacterium]